MKAFLIAFAIVVLGSLAAIAAVSLNRGAAHSEMTHETRAASGFHRLEISGAADVTLVQGAPEGVSIDAPASARVLTEVRNGTLVVETEDGRPWQWFSGRRAGRTPRVTINLRELDTIEAAGAVKIGAESLRSTDLRLDLSGAGSFRVRDLQATTLKLEGSGATKIDIAGKVARQEVGLSGAGWYQAGNLTSDDASVRVSGAGKALVNARRALTVDISGAGKVEYFGDPQLKQTISGVGKVTRRQPS
ncbi:MAG TPA: head GIN domain-containing protein [Casimicrobiaceae bacterium]